jgi:hypothetical protein
VILVLKRKCPIWLNSAGEVWIAAGDKYQIPLERAIWRDCIIAIDARVKSEIGAEKFESGSLRQELRS